jgi:glucose/arabinose dehydrogenase
MRQVVLAIAVAVAGLIAPSSSSAAPQEPVTPIMKFGAATDYGPFLTGSLDREKAVSKANEELTTEQLGPEKDPNHLATKSINIDLGNGAAVAFDADLLRYAAGWTGGFLDLTNTHLTSGKRSVPMTPKGTIAFTTRHLPGWSTDGKFADPRPKPYGPLPKDVAHFNGLYRHGRRVILSYTVGGVEVLDMPGAVKTDSGTVFTRELWVGPSKRSLKLLVSDPTSDVSAGVGMFTAGEEEGSVTGTDDGDIITLPPHDRARRYEIELTPKRDLALPASQETQIRRSFTKSDEAPTKGGPALWPDSIITQGTRAKDDKPYAVDSLTLPFDNPTHSWFRPGGFDFFSDGRIALCLMNGDVWICSGIDDSLQKLTWRRFAAGLYEPLGLRIVNDVVYVLGRDQITRLHDLNSDGEADFYENFNNDGVAASNYHSFAMDLQSDAAGNFYYSTAGQRAAPTLPHHGALMRVSPDGSKLDVFAAGLRAANGLGVGPHGELTAADNQGNWTPSSRLNLIRPGGFYGYVPHPTGTGEPRNADTYDPPICWIPMSIDNSSGGQVWSGDRFGPLSNRMFHTSYGRASVMLAFMHDAGDGVVQGGVIPLPFRFDSGVMRGRLSPADGQLYLTGQRGWQTAGNKDGCLVRLRYTGKPLYFPLDCRVLADGLELTFSQPLDPSTANDVESYGIEQWNYRWTKDYGSDDYSAADPTRKGHDTVPLSAARLQPDGRTVRLTIPGLKPVMQMRVQYDVDAMDSQTIKGDVYLTINRVPER